MGKATKSQLLVDGAYDAEVKFLCNKNRRTFCRICKEYSPQIRMVLGNEMKSQSEVHLDNHQKLLRVHNILDCKTKDELAVSELQYRRTT